MADNVKKPKARRKLPRVERKDFSNTHKLVKRPPAKLEKAENVIYVTAFTNIKAFEERCSKLIYEGVNEITIYALGATIKKAILLALQVAAKHLVFQISANTFTTDIIDDLEPATDELDYAIQIRANSALRIVLTRGM
ncbi:ribonuclease P protein subunit p20 [Atheta coriaria]|uniref:ribonuclease P protein subunit p20 n=1 Tax=Dalotia coriaria TaxID=877792 RepID=UPI0031F4029F